MVWITLTLTACAQGGKATHSPVSTVSEQLATQTLALATETRQPGCTVSSRKSTPSPTQQSLLPMPDEGDWAKGPADAYVTIVEYSDFQ